MNNMKKGKSLLKRIAVAVLALSLVLVPAPVKGAEKASTKGDEGLVSLIAHLQENREKDLDAFAFRSKKSSKKNTLLKYALKQNENSMPSSFDLRNVDTDGDGIPDTNYVTPVKNQGDFGSCWGFAANAAAETSILGSGLADGKYTSEAVTGSALQVLDLSEKHTMYFLGRPITDENSSQFGEGFHYIDESTSGIIDNGGTPFFATSLFASGAGPVSEYDNEQYEYHGKNKKIEYSGNGTPLYYSVDDDWRIDDDLRFEQDYVLKNSYILPNPAVFMQYDDPDDEDAPDEEDWEWFYMAVDVMKEQLLEGRGLEIGYCADEFINYETWAHYTCFSGYHANHAVTIIGYDDNYPKKNFEHKILNPEWDGEGEEEKYLTFPIPEHDGAWLVKNSWGSELEEFPNYNGNPWGLFEGQDKGVYNEATGEWEYNPVENARQIGYFWLSYEDKSIVKIEALEFERENDEKYYTAQYDFMPVINVNATFEDTEYKTTNIFAVSEFSSDEAVQVTDVACQTVTPGTSTNYQVYKLNKNYKNPTDGELIAEKNVVYKYGGFHKEALDSPVTLKHDDVFSVVVTQVTPDDMYAISTQSAPEFNELFYEECGVPYSGSICIGVVNEGESLLYSAQDNSWYDLCTTFLKYYLINDDNHEYFDIDNFPIKAYLTPYELTAPEVVAPKAKENLVYSGEKQELVEGGSVTGGTMYYALGTNDNDIPAETAFSQSIPTGVDSGNYCVWYKIVSDAEHTDADGGCVTVVINTRKDIVTDNSNVEPEVLQGLIEGEKGNEVEVSLVVKTVSEDSLKISVAKAIEEAITGTFNLSEPGADVSNLCMEYLDLSIVKKVDGVQGNVADAGKVLEVSFNIDTTGKYDPFIIVREHEGEVKVFDRLDSRPEKGSYKDATFFIEGSGENAKLYLYTQYFSVYSLSYSNVQLWKVTFDDGNGNTVTQTVVDGETVYRPSDPMRSGYSFLEWMNNGTYYDFSQPVNSDITLKASWYDDSSYSGGSYSGGSYSGGGYSGGGYSGGSSSGNSNSTGTGTDKEKVTDKNTDEPAKQEDKPVVKEQDSVTPEEKANALLTLNSGIKVYNKGTGVVVKWGKVDNANKYVIYAAYTGKKNKYKKIVSLSGDVGSFKITELYGKPIDKTKTVKVYVGAYRTVDGKSTKLAKSLLAYVAGSKNAKYTNIKDIVLEETKMSLEISESLTVNPQAVLKNKKKSALKNIAEFRFASSDESIATVDKSGNITAVGEGSCIIYVYSQNGYAKKIQVTVE
ncbi:MAG: InlB B-repeat-containing protein [Lachnospiraceae bacterium]|nr:InlB B-repeat-containing protein [Lachnospiraceae bacterium]